MIREKELDRNFKKALQNVPKPVNDTRASPEMESYLADLNYGKLKSEQTIKREAEDKSEQKKPTPCCPHCKRIHALKKTPSGPWCCGFCGLTSNSVAYLYE